MTKLLQLKHWQIFLLLIGLPILYQKISISFFLFTNNPTVVLVSYGVLIFLLLGIVTSWFYAAATNLYNRFPENVEMNLARFKLFLFIPIVYVLIIYTTVLGLVMFYGTGERLLETVPISTKFIQSNLGFIFILALLLSLLQLGALVCTFYCVHFTAKALKSVELGRKATFSDYSMEFFLILFFPVGIWLIQPRINALFTNNSETTDDIVLQQV
ncbi:hypothetical protein OCK74_18810 [Chitinophagaceae bacterium LB-8]|uniref:Uncharacterized protein n=1 Tax=Paraflavisolibacter caeni TaxID=2982496 RepID=A0A9X2XX93_9BACT|nr:hypothetical protein [Paraflavisolibacter caeni]MCU7551179.1 hypothetical protein [Paraflavisolibacter caeni]